MKRIRLLLGGLVVVLALAVSGGAPVLAHGTVDQTLMFDPGCTTGVFRATASSTGTLRQEFVPSASLLESMDVCLTLPGSTPVNMSIRTGTAAAPGAVIATASATPTAGTKWVDMDIPAAVAVTPGTMLVIELSQGSPASFVWRGTCGEVAGACTSNDGDLYPPGVSSALPGLADFGFRSYSPPDTDSDGLIDPLDNCPTVANPLQENNDRNFIDLPTKPYDDLTRAHSDLIGDACDGDDDNDGMGDADEASLPGPICTFATGGLDPTRSDTDGDRVLDGAECILGYDPFNPASKPPPIVAPDADNDGVPDLFDPNDGSNDSDGDKLLDGAEFRAYNTDPSIANTDGDTCNDAKEVASINGDLTVNAVDLGQTAQAFGNSTQPQYVLNFDVNKDGAIGAIDLSFIAQRFGSC